MNADLEVTHTEIHPTPMRDNPYRYVSVRATTGENASVEITEEYDPGQVEVSDVVARCADNLRAILRARR